jgi:hypothetical protein
MLHTMPESAWGGKDHFSWDRAVAELEDIWKVHNDTGAPILHHFEAPTR